MDALAYLIRALSQVKLELATQINKIIDRFVIQLPIVIQKVLNPSL